jgi:hypothetical protein
MFIEMMKEALPLCPPPILSLMFRKIGEDVAAETPNKGNRY